MTSVPELPRGWYFLGPVAAVNDKPKAFSVAGQRVVVFRTQSGKLGALESRCSHFGSDMSQGKVLGETLQCPFHGWQYGTDGKCVHIPSQKDIPGFACQNSFSVTERFGYLFFFPAAVPDYPLPFFDNQNDADFVCSAPLTYKADAPWYMVAANGFDLGHMQLMHGRALDGAPEFKPENRVLFRVRCGLKIVGTRWNDYVIKKIFGSKVRTHGDIWSGNLIMFEVFYGWLMHRYCIFIQPTLTGGLQADIFVVVKKPVGFLRRRLWMPFEIFAKRKMLAAFYGHEAKSFNGLIYDRHRAVGADRHILEFMEWLEQLPSGS